MILPRVIALVMISASAAAQAQQQPPAAPAAQPLPTPTASKVDKVCRIHMETNIPRRVCMTKEQWAQFDAQQTGTNLPGYDRQRCNTTTTLGAC